MNLLVDMGGWRIAYHKLGEIKVGVLTYTATSHTHTHKTDVTACQGEFSNMSIKWEWLVYVACFAVVLAVADMNMDKALGI